MELWQRLLREGHKITAVVRQRRQARSRLRHHRHRRLRGGALAAGAGRRPPGRPRLRADPRGVRQPHGGGHRRPRPTASAGSSATPSTPTRPRSTSTSAAPTASCSTSARTACPPAIVPIIGDDFRTTLRRHPRPGLRSARARSGGSTPSTCSRSPRSATRCSSPTRPPPGRDAAPDRGRTGRRGPAHLPATGAPAAPVAALLPALLGPSRPSRGRRRRWTPIQCRAWLTCSSSPTASGTGRRRPTATTRSPRTWAWPRWPTAPRSTPRSATSRPSTPTTACCSSTPATRSSPATNHERLRGRGTPTASAPWCSPTATSTTSSAWPRSRRRPPAQGWAPPHVVAHELLPARFERYLLTAGYNGVINQRQFQFASAVLADRVPPARRALPRPPHARRSAARRGSCTTTRARPTTPPGCGTRAARCCAPATCSSGPARTAATRRRSSATRGSGRSGCARCRPSAPRCSCPATASRSSAPTGSTRPSATRPSCSSRSWRRPSS